MVKLFSKNSNLCDHNSPTLRTDRQTTCDRNTALCIKVHRAVKSEENTVAVILFQFYFSFNSHNMRINMQMSPKQRLKQFHGCFSVVYLSFDLDVRTSETRLQEAKLSLGYSQP